MSCNERLCFFFRVGLLQSRSSITNSGGYLVEKPVWVLRASPINHGILGEASRDAVDDFELQILRQKTPAGCFTFDPTESEYLPDQFLDDRASVQAI